MKTRIKKTILVMAAAGLVVLIGSHGASAGSLYEYYTSTEKETLKKETGDMGRELRASFKQGSVAKQQQKIDFAEYFSNLKKTVLFSTRLATYSEYETDLKFARDKEVFKGLPEEGTGSGKKAHVADRKDFVRNKFSRMKKNVEEEIETYDDLIRLSLDACETITKNDLSGILDNPAFRGKVNHFTEGEAFKEYRAKQGRFKQRWTEISKRISAQFALWQPSPASPDDPIINPRIIGAI